MIMGNLGIRISTGQTCSSVFVVQSVVDVIIAVVSPHCP